MESLTADDEKSELHMLAFDNDLSLLFSSIHISSKVGFHLFEKVSWFAPEHAVSITKIGIALSGSVHHFTKIGKNVQETYDEQPSGSCDVYRQSRAFMQKKFATQKTLFGKHRYEEKNMGGSSVHLTRIKFKNKF